MFRLIIYTIRISYIAISNISRLDFSRWCTVKKRLNFFLNREIFRWMAINSDSSKCSLNNQFILDSIIEVIFMHFHHRMFIYRFSKKMPCFNRKIFIQISVMYLLFELFVKLMREIASMLYVYKEYSLTNKKLVNLSLNFPLHSFSIPSKRKSGDCYSFGEYLTWNYSNISLISVGEYVRQSDRKDKRILDKDVSKFKRYNPEKAKKFIIFFSKFLIVTIRFLFEDRTRNKGIFLKLIYVRKYLYKFNFTNMLRELGLNYEDVENIFTLPFADIGLLKYDNEISQKTLAFSYSQNALILPSPRIQEITDQRTLFQYLPLYALTLTGKSYGFTSLYHGVNQIKEKLNKEFSLNLPVTYSKLANENPLMLGYETVYAPPYLKDKSLGRRFVAIFDLPPESEYQSISRALLGDKVCDYKFIQNFILDVVETSITNGFSIIIKPKYSLSNYTDSYGSLLRALKEKYKDKFTIADPYLNMGVIVKHSSCSVNMPYSSTKLIFDYNQIPSIYYAPEKYMLDFTKNCSIEITFGLDSLNSFFKNL